MRNWVSIAGMSLFMLVLVVAGGLYAGGNHSANPEQNVQPFPQASTSNEYRHNDLGAGSVADLAVKPVNHQHWYRNQVVVLMYHHIADDKSKPFAITPEQFARHMAFLYEHDLHPISLSEFLRFVDTGELSTENAVLITFDDGYESYYSQAFPVLRQYGFPSVNFVIAGRLRDSAERKREGMITPLTEDEIRVMLASGLVEIGSHTYSLHEQSVQSEWGKLKPGTAPVYLEDLNRIEEDQEYRNRLYVDFTISRVALADLVKEPVVTIALPHGYKNQTVIETAKEAGYRYVFTSRPAVVKPGVNPFDIPRYDVGLPDEDVTKLEQVFAAAKTAF